MTMSSGQPRLLLVLIVHAEASLMMYGSPVDHACMVVQVSSAQAVSDPGSMVACRWLPAVLHTRSQGLGSTQHRLSLLLHMHALPFCTC